MNITGRTTHPVQQGTGAWLKLRESYCTASEAPAALGVSRYVTRAELMRRKHTGYTPEPDAATLGRFAAGHAAEDSARPMAEGIVGSDLFPVTMTAEVDDLRLLASLDGLTFDDEIAWETKLWNEELAECVRRGELPAHYTVQMDQELMVSGAKRCLFTCTDGTSERFVSCWYEADPAKFSALVAGWLQFNSDLSAYVLPESAAETVRAEPIESLPTVSVRLDGALSVAGNLPSFAVALREFVAKIPTNPATDTEFATTEAACKALKKAEEALDAAEAGALASISDVDAMRRAVADCRKLARDTRLAAEKMVERRKVEIKEAAVLRARRALDAHIATLNAELAPMRLPAIAADFAGCIKGLKSLSSINDKLDGLLATAKIAAEADARAIRDNVATFKAQAAGLEFLFSDLGQIVHKAADDFGAVVESRIATHRAAEAAREEKRKADEVARIAAEAKRLADEQIARQAADAALKAAAAQLPEAPGSQQVLKAEPATADATARDVQATTSPRAGAMGVGQAAGAAPAANEPATLNLGAICGRLGFTVSAQFVADVLGVHPARTEKAGRYYTERQFALICRGIASHVVAIAQQHAAEKACA